MEKRRLSDNGDKEQIRQLELNVTRLEERLGAADKALQLARESLDQWKATSNEWRNENIDQRRLFATIDRVEAIVAVESGAREALEGRVRVLEQTAQALLGKDVGSNYTWGVALIVAGLLISLTMVVIHFMH